jgi:hypothetical protein
LTDDTGCEQSAAKHETTKQFNDHEKLTFLEMDAGRPSWKTCASE